MQVLTRAREFLQKPLHEQSRSFYARWKQVFPRIPVPVRLSFGAWWLARDDFLGSTLTFDGFEPSERGLLQRFLRPGMTVVDVGAHHGFHTLLASKLVGSSGRVFAFEPSQRERKALRINLALNACRNVEIQNCALGATDGDALLHVAKWQSGCNSLRPPVVSEATSPTRVKVKALDSWMRESKVATVDFIKLDVEGGELEVLRGAERMLAMSERPVILAEVEDSRTRPWGYEAREIIDHMSRKGYKWFSVAEEGIVKDLDVSRGEFEGNFVACPEESVSKLARTT